jgi:hypothetical protein
MQLILDFENLLPTQKLWPLRNISGIFPNCSKTGREDQSFQVKSTQNLTILGKSYLIITYIYIQQTFLNGNESLP